MDCDARLHQDRCTFVRDGDPQCKTAKSSDLFTPIEIGSLKLPNRVVMAPVKREPRRRRQRADSA